ncbi:hypothetical protein BH23PLA1_BH23PLA1_07140 [soil metagenome]
MKGSRVFEIVLTAFVACAVIVVLITTDPHGDSSFRADLAQPHTAGAGNGKTASYGLCEAANAAGNQITPLDCEADPNNFGEPCIRCEGDTYDVLHETMPGLHFGINRFSACEGAKKKGQCVKNANPPFNTYCSNYQQVLNPDGSFAHCEGDHIPQLITQTGDDT